METHLLSLSEQPLEEEADSYDVHVAPGSGMLPRMDMRRRSVDHLRAAIQRHERRRTSEHISDSDVRQALHNISISGSSSGSGSRGRNPMDKLRSLVSQQQQQQHPDSKLLQNKLLSLSTLRIPAAVPAGVKQIPAERSLGRQLHTADMSHSSLPHITVYRDGEQQEAGDDGDEDGENGLGQMDADTMSLPLPHVTAAIERPPTLSAASSTATLASRHRHASQQSFTDESNLLAVTQQQGSRRGSVQLLKALIEQQQQHQQHLGQGQLQSTGTAADVIGSDPLTFPQSSPSRSTTDQLLDGDVLVTSPLQQAKSSKSKQQLNADSSTNMRDEEQSTELVLIPPPSSRSVPQSRAGSIATIGKTSVTRPTNYLAEEIISFISRKLQDNTMKSLDLSEVKDMLKKEWKSRQKVPGQVHEAASAAGRSGSQLNMDTPLMLAMRQNEPEVAEVIATFHSGDWLCELSDTDTTALLYCLKNGSSWHALALRMTRRMADQMRSQRAGKGGLSSALLVLFNTESGRSSRRSRDIVAYLSRQTDTSLGPASALHLAAYHGLEDVIEAIIDCGIDVDTAVGANFYTPLCFAITGRQVACTAMLMARGANPNMNISRGSVATLAVTVESVDIVQLLLQHSDVQRKSTVRSNRKQMLRTAVRIGKPHLIRLLAENCEVDDKDAVACFRFAMATGSMTTARELVLSGIVLNATDNSGDTPLIMAIRSKEIDLVKTLLSRGANTDVRNSEGKTFWNFVLEQAKDSSLQSANELAEFYNLHTLFIKAAELNDMASLTFLLTDPNTDITQTDSHGETIFHHAAKSGGSNLFALLEATTKKGRVYEHLLDTLKCTESELQQMIQRCISELPKTNSEGKTALHLACESGLYVAVKYLARFTDIQSVDNTGKSVLHCAAANLRAEQAEKILKWLLVTQGTTADVTHMINLADNDGNTPMHIAVKKANIAAVQILSITANPNQVNKSGLSSFHSALFEQSENFFASFLETIDRNDPSQLYLYIFLDSHVNQMPLLHNLAKAGEIGLIRLLIARGANVLKKDRSGNTVLHHIARLISETRHVSHTEDLLDVAAAIIDEAVASRHHTEMYLKHITGGRSILPNNASFDKMKITFYLTRCVPNSAGQSVLTYAGDLGVAEYIEWLLQPITKDEGVKLADDKNVVCSAAYDVTFLTPQCIQWANYKGPSGDSSNTCDLPNRNSLLEAVLKSDRFRMGSQIFDIMPMMFLLQKFISVYQWFYCLILLVHVGYMILLTYFSYVNLRVTSANSTPPDIDDTINGNVANNGAFLTWPILLCVLSFVNVKHLFRQYHLSVSIHERLLDEQLSSYAIRLALALAASLPCGLHFALTLAWYFAVMNCDPTTEVPLKYSAFVSALVIPAAICLLYVNMRNFRKKLKINVGKLVLLVTPFVCNAFLFLGISLAPNDCDVTSHYSARVLQATMTRRYYGIFLLVPSLELLVSLCLITWCLTRVLVLLTTNSYHMLRDVVVFILHNLYIVATLTFVIVVVGWYVTCMRGIHEQIYFLAATLIVGWLLSIHFTHCFRGMHMFGLILKQCLYDDAVRFALMYGLVTAGFSCAISVLYYDFPDMLAEQPTPLDTMYQALKVTVGLGDLIDSSLDFGTANYYSLRPWAGLKLIYIVYIIFSNIVLLNIMIAMVQRTYENMANYEEVSWREWRYNNIMFVMRLPQRIRTMVEYLGSTKGVRSHVKTMTVTDDLTMLILFVNDMDQHLK